MIKKNGYGPLKDVNFQWFLWCFWMIEEEVYFLDCSLECLHLDSLDYQVRLDVLVLFGPDSKAGGSGTVSQSLRKPEHWGHN